MRPQTFRIATFCLAVLLTLVALGVESTQADPPNPFFVDTQENPESATNNWRVSLGGSAWNRDEILATGNFVWSNCDNRFPAFGQCADAGITRSWVAVASNSMAYTIDVDIWLNGAGQECKVIFTGANQNEDYRVDLRRAANDVRISAPAPSNVTSWSPGAGANEITGGGTKYHLAVAVTRSSITVTYKKGENAAVSIAPHPTGIVPDGKVGVGTFSADCDFDNVTVSGTEGTGTGFANLIPVFGYERTEGCNEGPPNPIQHETLTEQQCDRPLFAPWNRDSQAWWNAMVEEMDYAGIKVVAAHNRGCYTAGEEEEHGFGDMCPRQLDKLVEAIYARGSDLKIAMFDDLPTAGDDYKRVYGQTFDLIDPNPNDPSHALWQEYFWLKRWNPFFDTVPADLRATFLGRPLVFVWAAVNFENRQGNLSKVFDYLRGQTQSAYGFNPFIVGYEYLRTAEDASLGNPGKMDAFYSWHNPALSPPVGTLDASVWPQPPGPGSYLGATAIPGFRDFKGLVEPHVGEVVGQPACGAICREVPRQHGNTLIDALEKQKSTHFVLLEGWTNVIESAGYYRSLEGNDPHGCTQAAEQNKSDFPNQSLHIVRRYASADTSDVTLEAETADVSADAVVGNSGGAYRPSNYANSACGPYNDIDVFQAADGRYYVGDNEFVESFGWRDLFLPTGTYHAYITYATPFGDTGVCVGANGRPDHACADTEVPLPSTGGWDNYSTYDLGWMYLHRGLHDIDVLIQGNNDLRIDKIRLCTLAC